MARSLLRLGLVAGMLAAPSAVPGAASAARPQLAVVAAENFWGSIAAQLGGDRATVSSIVVNPGTDPHDYNATPSDAIELAGAQLAIVNGIGYDDWAKRLVAANPVRGRIVLTIGDLLGLKEGDNPHQWYSPTAVRRVVDAITADLQRLDPPAAAYFAARKRHFETRSLARYDGLRREIRRRFAGVAVGYSESIFEPLGRSLGLRLLTPPGFAKAIAEGGEVSVQDKETVDRQAERHLIKVWVFNDQNVTPEVQQVNAIARAKHIPVVTVTETLSPAAASFEQWQVSELEALLAALHRATGR